MTAVVTQPLRFHVSRERIPTAPPEHRGVARDGVKLLVAAHDRVHHARFHQLGEMLRPGDLIVVNTSTTRPAALEARVDDRPVVLHFSTPAPDGPAGTWIVELRRADGRGPVLDALAGVRVDLAGEGTTTLREARASGPDGDGVRLWFATVRVPSGDVEAHLRRWGRPITYGQMAPQWPLEDYQTVFARHPASAEMPSAARPFSLAVVGDLVRHGITLAPLQLHAGVSSQLAHEPPQPERFVVPRGTAALVNHTRANGGRIVAVGTTVTRALETVTDSDGAVRAGRGRTDLVLSPDRPARVVDGLITGWHEADASHLELLKAVAGQRLVGRAYEAALLWKYDWHEFGDSCLLLPARDGR